VNQLNKLEIKAIVDHVGHLEQLKQLVTEFALQVVKQYKPEFQLKIY
jgi:hypothetical protein